MSLCFGSCLDVSHEVDLLYECPGSVDKVTVNGGYRFTLYVLMTDGGLAGGVTFDKAATLKSSETLVVLGLVSLLKSTILLECVSADGSVAPCVYMSCFIYTMYCTYL